MIIRLSNKNKKLKNQGNNLITRERHWQEVPISLNLFSREEYAAQQKAMEVCDTCGAFLIVGDAQQRIDDHLLGKQHVGYAR